MFTVRSFFLCLADSITQFYSNPLISFLSSCPHNSVQLNHPSTIFLCWCTTHVCGDGRRSRRCLACCIHSHSVYSSQLDVFVTSCQQTNKLLRTTELPASSEFSAP